MEVGKKLTKLGKGLESMIEFGVDGKEDLVIIPSQLERKCV